MIAKIFSIFVFVVVIGAALVYWLGFSSPSAFVAGSSIIVDSGQSLSGIARELGAQHIVRSPFIFRSLVIMLGGERTTSAGMYVFDSRQNVFTVANRIAHGNYGYVATKITIPEGLTSYEIASLVAQKFPSISSTTVYTEFEPKEGYLFPDTYFFPPEAPLSMIADRLESQFKKNIAPFEPEITASGHSLNEVITVASILEAEVKTTADRKMVSDLIWRRIAAGIPLQMDSTVGYITGKTSADLTVKDLKIDSPYNTYRYKGLPPTPISNPGLDSITAALEPTSNAYLFFLSDKDGITHFAKTYVDHQKNKQKYLR